MKVLVTGATGFVGACLTRRLVGLGHDVHILIRHESPLWRISDILSSCSVHFVDLRDSVGLERCVSAIRPSVVCHQATYGGFAAQRDSDAIIATNFLGTVNLLRASEKAGFDCFINTGSSSEYGFKQTAMKESDFLEPIGDYGVAKAAATMFCSSEALLKKLPVVTLRIFSPYGAWDDPSRFVPTVATALLRGESPELSTPASVRDYIFIDDVIDLYLRIMAGPILPGAVFNAGSGTQHSLGDLVNCLTSIIDNGVQPKWGARPVMRPEPTCWVADMGEVAATFGWHPPTPLREGLVRTVAWLRENIGYYSPKK